MEEKLEKKFQIWLWFMVDFCPNIENKAPQPFFLA
jgi:hypothetical protein